MNAFQVPFKVVATILMTGSLVTIGLFNLRARATWNDPSDGIFWVESERGLVAAEVAQDGPGAPAGISPGDVLNSVNGRPIENLGQYFNLIDSLGVNASVTYRLTSDSVSKDVTLQLAARPLLEPRDGLRTLLAFLHLGIGLFVVLRGSRQPRAFHFYLVCVAAFVVYLYSYTNKWDALDKTVYGLSIAALLLLPSLFMHFFLRFPVDLAQRRSRAPLLYLPAVILGLLQLLWTTGRLVNVGLPINARSIQLLDRIHLVYFCVGFLVGSAILLKRRIGARDLTTRQQMKWVSYGTLAGIGAFCLMYVFPVLLGFRASFAMEASMLFLGLIPLTFAYALVHYRLLDVEFIMRRGVAYFVASSLLLSLYVLFVLVVGRALEWVAPEADFIVICIGALAVALLFAPLRSRIQTGLDRFFYKEQFDDRASLLEFARTLSTEISLAPLSCKILERVSKTFRVSRVALYLADSLYPGFYRLADAIGIEVPNHEPKLYRAEDLVGKNDPGGIQGRAGSHQLYKTNAPLSNDGIVYFQDLNLRGRRIGMIGLGPLPQDKHFSTEDLDLLAALAGYAAIALENASLYRSIEAKAMELERLKIYTDNIIESINVAVLALDLSGRITSCNRAFEELYGVTRAQVVGTMVESLFPPDVIESIRRATGSSTWELTSSTNIFRLYLENRRRENLIVDLGIIPLRDSVDIHSGCLIVIEDITAKVRLQDQLLQAEKLSSIGLLAAGIAHEVNTPITGISSFTQMLLKEMPETDHRKSILEKIERQTFRAAEIVNGLLNFARISTTKFEDLDINKLIAESLSLIEHSLKRSAIRVESSLDPLLPKVYGNSGKLQQVLVNLFLNARDAMNSGGELRIRTAKNDLMVIVEISDTGEGISKENIKKIYDPFFTTRGMGRGTGLGLAITYGIIQEHGGGIFVDSTPGRGTQFTLKLPTRQALHIGVSGNAAVENSSPAEPESAQHSKH